MSETGRPQHLAWALAVAVIAVALILTGGLVYVFRSARSLPAEMAETGRKALSELREVAVAFRTGSVTTTFRGDATSVAGTTRLQFAELRQDEVFERRDAAAVLWGTLALPDVVVEARVPVAYTYFLDLDKEWRFRLEEGVVEVRVPPVEWNRPAPDVSALRFSVREGSMLRDEQLVLDRLRASSRRSSTGAHGSTCRSCGRPDAARSRRSWRPGSCSASPTVSNTGRACCSPTRRRRPRRKPRHCPRRRARAAAT
jgi:hypothetical protein